MAVPLQQFTTQSPDVRGVFINTTDATQTIAARFTTRPDHAYAVKARIIATETVDHDEVAYYERAALFNNDGGTLAIVGSIAAPVTIETTAGWDVTIVAAVEDNDGDGTSANANILIKVTGAAATVATWQVKMDVMELGGYISNYGPTG